MSTPPPATEGSEFHRCVMSTRPVKTFSNSTTSPRIATIVTSNRSPGITAGTGADRL